MTDFYDLIRYEEGWRSKPYLCSEGYPTVGFGFRIGPKGTPISHYDLELPPAVGEVWLLEHAKDIIAELNQHASTRRALDSCLAADRQPAGMWMHGPRASVLVSMAYQMGVWGLLKFNQTLTHVGNAAWSNAEGNMLNSLWAKQTPARAKRHAVQMRTGVWDQNY